MRTYLFLAVSLFSCVTKTSGGEISPKLTPLYSSHDCQNCLFTELGVRFTFKCNLAKDTNSAVVDFRVGSNIGFRGERESTGVYVYRSYTIKEEDHLLNVRCIASVVSSTFPYKTEETSATLYITKRPSRMTLTTSNVNITCVAGGGHPAPTLVMKSDGIVQPVLQSNVRDTLGKQSTYTTTAFVKDLMKLSKGQTISCCTTTSFFTEMCATPQTLDFQRNEEVTESTIDSATTVRSDPATVFLVTQTTGYVAGALVPIVIIVLLVFFLWYRRRSSGDNCNAKNATIKSNANPVFVKPILPSNEYLTNQEQAEYTEIGIPADGQSGYVNQHTYSNATGSNYEVPDILEPSKGAKDYENEKDQYEHTPANTYDHVYTAPLEHQYSALDATK